MRKLKNGVIEIKIFNQKFNSYIYTINDKYVDIVRCGYGSNEELINFILNNTNNFYESNIDFSIEYPNKDLYKIYGKFYNLSSDRLSILIKEFENISIEDNEQFEELWED